MVWQNDSYEWRGDLYALLGLAYYREPTRAFIEGLVEHDPFSRPPFLSADEQMARGLRHLSASLEPFRGGVSDRGLERLQGDHCQLFVGSGMPKAPPWESFYRTEEGLMVSSHTLEVRAFYERFGLVSERRKQEPEDHIGLELEFMACLCDRHGECLGKGDVREAAVTAKAQRDFLDSHLLRWVSRFCEALDRFAWTDFFRGMGRLTEGFLAWDRRFLDEPPAEGLGYAHETGRWDG